MDAVLDGLRTNGDFWGSFTSITKFIRKKKKTADFLSILLNGDKMSQNESSIMEELMVRNSSNLAQSNPNSSQGRGES